MYGFDFSMACVPDYIPQIFCFLEGHCIDCMPQGMLDTANLPQAECYWLIG